RNGSKVHRSTRRPPPSDSCAPPQLQRSPSKSPASPSKIEIFSTAWPRESPTPSRVAARASVRSTSSPLSIQVTGPEYPGQSANESPVESTLARLSDCHAGHRRLHRGALRPRPASPSASGQRRSNGEERASP